MRQGSSGFRGRFVSSFGRFTRRVAAPFRSRTRHLPTAQQMLQPLWQLSRVTRRLSKKLAPAVSTTGGLKTSRRGGWPGHIVDATGWNVSCELQGGCNFGCEPWVFWCCHELLLQRRRGDLDYIVFHSINFFFRFETEVGISNAAIKWNAGSYSNSSCGWEE